MFRQITTGLIDQPAGTGQKTQGTGIEKNDEHNSKQSNGD